VEDAIIVHRGFAGARLRRFRIYIDGEQVGRIRSGESLSFPVKPGAHRVHVQLDWLSRSREVEVVVPPDAQLWCIYHGALASMALLFVQPRQSLGLSSEQSPEPPVSRVLVRVGALIYFGFILACVLAGSWLASH
jgi:hypothetical protein